MEILIGDRVKVVNVNYEHTKRVNNPLPSIIGMKGTFFRKSKMEKDAYNIELENGTIVLLYRDELVKI